MAINKKLIHFKTKAAFEAQLAGNNILGTSIVFIQDANLIWTHGTYYCLPSDEVVISNGIEPDKDQDLWIDTSDNTTATFIEEAPIDGKRYVRKNGTWVATLNEVYVGETSPSNGEIVWINPGTDEMKYFNGTQWVTVSGKTPEEEIPTEETLIINLVSNQTDPDSNLNGVIVNVRYLDADHKQAWAGEALSFKIPNGTEYTIEYGDITDSEGNKMYTTPVTETFTAAGNKFTLSRYYNSEKLTVNVSGVSSGFTVTVNGQNQTTTSRTYYIPYGTAYTISASLVKGYMTEISESSVTASQQTRTITVTYATIPNGIYIYDNTGNLTTVESWDTSNNSSAIGVAVISDKCSFVMDKAETYSVCTWGGYDQTISGVVITPNTGEAVSDYKGNENTTKIISQLGSSKAPAASYCRGKSLTVNGTTLYGYLGALGEWQTACNNRSSIDDALRKIGGTAVADYYYWTSTQYSMNYAWVLYWGGGRNTSDTKKSERSHARAFYPLP